MLSVAAGKFTLPEGGIGDAFLLSPTNGLDVSDGSEAEKYRLLPK